MARTYKTPGVYVEEISTLPPAVAEVSTAVPAFVGYTEESDAEDGSPQVEQIRTLLEYEEKFGKDPVSSFDVTTQTVDGVELLKSVARSEGKLYLMHYAVRMHFSNGGGKCYIVSVGKYPESAPSRETLAKGVEALRKEDEPTIVVVPDSPLLDAAEHHQMCKDMLKLCGEMRDRFAVMDVQAGDDDASAFRNAVASDYLAYGAAYHPYLVTGLTYRFDEKTSVHISDGAAGVDRFELTAGPLRIRWEGTGATPRAQITLGDENDPVAFVVEDDKLKITGVRNDSAQDVIDAWAQHGDDPKFSIDLVGDGAAEVSNMTSTPLEKQTGGGGRSLESIKTSNTALYHQVRKALQSQFVTMPPSSAIAGVYCRVDRDRGVWKSPANVPLNMVTAPALKITDGEQDELNVDPTAGKSINVIRAFTGKGVLVWGARTLAGNDNEWRYVSVRRLFNMIEESSQKSTAFAVFEANDATTWLKVKGMIESFLYGMWERGALAGPSPESAYFVDVGLGKTMTQDDILNGRMIVRIGIAAVRPSEFIILEFMHKLQEA